MNSLAVGDALSSVSPKQGGGQQGDAV